MGVVVRGEVVLVRIEAPPQGFLFFAGLEPRALLGYSIAPIRGWGGDGGGVARRRGRWPITVGLATIDKLKRMPNLRQQKPQLRANKQADPESNHGKKPQEGTQH